MTTDTPRTDAAEPQLHSNVGGWVRADFARELEQELAASKAEVERLTKELADWDYGTRAKREQDARKKAEAEVERLGKLLFETRSLLTEFFDCVDIGGLHDGDCNISTEDPEKWDLGCNCTTADLRKKYIELYSK